MNLKEIWNRILSYKPAFLREPTSPSIHAELLEQIVQYKIGERQRLRIFYSEEQINQSTLRLFSDPRITCVLSNGAAIFQTKDFNIPARNAKEFKQKHRDSNIFAAILTEFHSALDPKTKKKAREYILDATLFYHDDSFTTAEVSGIAAAINEVADELKATLSPDVVFFSPRRPRDLPGRHNG